MNNDLISRQAAIDAIEVYFNGLPIAVHTDMIAMIHRLPSAQPERLSDDDFETIRIHLNAYKENLCNQHRWEEAEEYQRIINRFIAFASAQPEIIRCKDCKHQEIHEYNYGGRTYRSYGCELSERYSHVCLDDDFCSRAERRTDEAD